MRTGPYATVGFEIGLLNEIGRIGVGVAELDAATQRNAYIRILPHDIVWD